MAAASRRLLATARLSWAVCFHFFASMTKTEESASVQLQLYNSADQTHIDAEDTEAVIGQLLRVR